MSCHAYTSTQLNWRSGTCCTGTQRLRPLQQWHTTASRARCRASIRAEGGGQGEDDFEKRLATLKKAKGETPYGKSRKEKPSAVPAPGDLRQKQYDFRDEALHWEGTPHRGDLAINVLLGSTLLWLPLTAAAVGRAAFIKYRFTDRRLSVSTDAPWKKEQLDAPYQDIKDVKTVGRGLGFWGDMVITLRNGDKIELRSLPQFRELRDYILKRREELSSEDGTPGRGKNVAKGFA